MQLAGVSPSEFQSWALAAPMGGAPVAVTAVTRSHHARTPVAVAHHAWAPTRFWTASGVPTVGPQQLPPPGPWAGRPGPGAIAAVVALFTVPKAAFTHADPEAHGLAADAGVAVPEGGVR